MSKQKMDQGLQAEVAQKLEGAAKIRKERAQAPMISPFTFTAGQAVAITIHGKQVPGYKYVRSTERFHVVTDASGTETRVWFNYCFPAIA